MVSGSASVWRRRAAHCGIWISLTVLLYPFANMVWQALTAHDQAGVGPRLTAEHLRLVLGLTEDLDAYGRHLSAKVEFWRWVGNSLKVAVSTTLLATALALSTGYAFARLRFRLRNFLFTLCVGSMLLPTMVTLIPLYIMWTKFFNMSNTFWPLILPYLCGGGAFNIFLIRQFVRSIPRELDEAATIDGAGYFRILLNVIVPSIKSAMIVVAMFLFIQIWNDLLQQMIYINTDDKFTISMGLSQLKGSLKTDWSAIMCGTCMSFVPGVVFYLLGQRYFVEGIVMTGMKN